MSSDTCCLYMNVAEQDIAMLTKHFGEEDERDIDEHGVANLVFYSIPDVDEKLALLLKEEIPFFGCHSSTSSDTEANYFTTDRGNGITFHAGTMDGYLSIHLEIGKTHEWEGVLKRAMDKAKGFQVTQESNRDVIQMRARHRLREKQSAKSDRNEIAKEISELLDWVEASIDTIPHTTRHELKGRVESLRKLLSDAPAIEPGTKHKVLIHVEAGIVQATFSTDPKNIEVFVRDFDNVEPGEEPIEYMSISDPIDDPRATEGK